MALQSYTYAGYNTISCAFENKKGRALRRGLFLHIPIDT